MTIESALATQGVVLMFAALVGGGFAASVYEWPPRARVPVYVLEGVLIVGMFASWFAAIWVGVKP